MKDIIRKVSATVMVACMTLMGNMNNVSAAYNFGDPTELGDKVENMEMSAIPLINVVAAIILYVSIVIVGLNVLMYRNKEEERSNAMTGLLYIAIGALILCSAHFIREMLVNI